MFPKKYLPTILLPIVALSAGCAMETGEESAIATSQHSIETSTCIAAGMDVPYQKASRSGDRWWAFDFVVRCADGSTRSHWDRFTLQELNFNGPSFLTSSPGGSEPLQVYGLSGMPVRYDRWPDGRWFRSYGNWNTALPRVLNAVAKTNTVQVRADGHRTSSGLVYASCAMTGQTCSVGGNFDAMRAGCELTCPIASNVRVYCTTNGQSQRAVDSVRYTGNSTGEQGEVWCDTPNCETTFRNSDFGGYGAVCMFVD